MDNKAEDVKKFAARYPLLFAFIYFSLSFCLNTAILLVGQHVTAITLIGFVAVVTQSLLALGALAWLGWLRSAGFNGPAQWRNLYLFWLPALLALLYIASALVTPLLNAAALLLAIVFALLTGLNEEANYRGVILHGLSPYRPLVAAALAAFFFGLAHLNNLLAHLPPQIVLGQVTGGFLLGFGFAACRLRTRTIWPLILFHALYDLPANILLFDVRSNAAIYAMLAQISPATIILGLIAPGFLLACYGLFLLRSCS
jgi:uncharacterized protein